MGTTRPVSSSALRKGARCSSRSCREAERGHVVVVEGDAPGAELGEPVHGLHRVERRAHGAAEDVDALPADGPEAERELVLGGGGEVGHRQSFLS